MEVTFEGETFEIKTRLHFLIGDQILDQVKRRIIQLGLSRNEWLTRAILKALNRRDPIKASITAEMLMGDKSPVHIHVTSDIAEAVEDAANKRGVSQTAWLTDAVISELVARSIKTEG